MMTHINDLETPQLLIDLDIVDANLKRMLDASRQGGVHLRVHFKSLKCGGLANYLTSKGVERFLCAKLNEAEVLVDAGQTDVLIANQIVGPDKLARLARLAKRAKIGVCVDHADNVRAMSQAAQTEGATIEVLVEVDIGMKRCGVEPGAETLALARVVHEAEGLRFVGLQGYDGHLQQIADPAQRRAQCESSLEQLVGSRRLLEEQGIPVEVVTGAGTGTWEFVVGYRGVTEIQPGSFVLMDCFYHQIRPEFGCALSILSTVISRRPQWYVLDAGSKAVSQDFGTPCIKNHPEEKGGRLAEEHARIEDGGNGPQLGERREVLPAHCCATMNLHRRCFAIRKGQIEAVWPIEASGRYD